MFLRAKLIPNTKKLGHKIPRKIRKGKKNTVESDEDSEPEQVQV